VKIDLILFPVRFTKNRAIPYLSDSKSVGYKTFSTAGLIIAQCKIDVKLSPKIASKPATTLP